MENLTCPSCKSELDPEYAFCPECGERIDIGDSTGENDGIEDELAAGLKAEMEAESKSNDDEPEDETAEKSIEPEAEPEPEPESDIEPPKRKTKKEADDKKPAPPARFQLVRLARGGNKRSTYSVPDRGIVIGRVNSDISFPEDETVSPRHATLRPSREGVSIDDTGSLNGVFYMLKSSHELSEGDTFMCGDQLFRFSMKTSRMHSNDFRLYAAPREKKVIATLTHVLSDGIDGEVYGLMSPSFSLGREEGEVRFGTDRFMSRRHASINKSDKGFDLEDQGSRNGTYVCRRGVATLKAGDIFMVGRQMLRLEAVSP